MGLFSNFGGESHPTNNNEEEKIISNEEGTNPSPEETQTEGGETPKPEEETVVDLEQNKSRIITRLQELEGKDDLDSNEERADLQRQLDMIEDMSGPKAY